MAAQTTSTVAPVSALFSYRIVASIESAWNAFVAWNIQRKTAAELNALTDHELEDIGLSRGDISRITVGRGY